VTVRWCGAKRYRSRGAGGLARRGARVTLSDSRAELPDAARLRSLGVRLELGGQRPRDVCRGGLRPQPPRVARDQERRAAARDPLVFPFKSAREVELGVPYSDPGVDASSRLHRHQGEVDSRRAGSRDGCRSVAGCPGDRLGVKHRPPLRARWGLESTPVHLSRRRDSAAFSFSRIYHVSSVIARDAEFLSARTIWIGIPDTPLRPAKADFENQNAADFA